MPFCISQFLLNVVKVIAVVIRINVDSKVRVCMAVLGIAADALLKQCAPASPSVAASLASASYRCLAAQP